MIVKELGSKYIGVGAEFEINIGSECGLKIH